MKDSKIVSEGITFDDVLLIPAKSDFVPSQADTKTRLTNNIVINIPIVSAAMDTVTESALAIALAQEGGIGIIHKNLSIEEQRLEVAKVKRSSSNGSNSFRSACLRDRRFVAVPGSSRSSIIRHNTSTANGQRTAGECPCKVTGGAALGKSPKGYK